MRDDFDDGRLPAAFQWLRTPYPEELFSLTARPGHLRLYGRETIGSLFRQALVARRQQAHCYSASTAIEFEPEHFQQAAGLVCYYGGNKFHYLHVSHDEAIGKHVRVMSALPDSPQADAFSTPLAVPSGQPIELRVEVDHERLLFRLPRGPRGVDLAVRSSTPASSPTRPRRPAPRTSPAPSWGWHARTWPAPRARPTSTGSSTGSGSTWPTPAGRTVRSTIDRDQRRGRERTAFGPIGVPLASS